MKRLLSCVVLSVLVAGCSTTNSSPVLSGDQVAASTKRTYDQYTKSTDILGPRVEIHSVFGSGEYYSGGYRLRTWKTEAGYSTVQLYLDFKSSEWAFLFGAAASTGEEVEVVQIDRKVDTGGMVKVNEIIGANFDLDWLRRHSTGFSVRFYGKRMNCDVQVPASYIQGFLKALD